MSDSLTGGRAACPLHAVARGRWSGLGMSGRDPFRYLTQRARDADWNRRRGGPALTPGLVIVRLVIFTVMALVVLAALDWFASRTGSGEPEATPTFEAPVFTVLALFGL